MQIKSATSSDIGIECDEVIDSLNRELIAGETWNVVDKSWFDQYRKYAEAIKSGNEAHVLHPGPIDNSNLLQSSPSEWALKSDLVENCHFVLVPQASFQRLASRFGLHSSQHEIGRKVIQSGLMKNQLQIELNPLMLYVRHPVLKMSHRMKISRSEKIASFCRSAAELLGIPTEDTCLRLFLKHKDIDMELLNFSPDSTLEDFNLYSDQVLVVDFKNSDGSWNVGMEKQKSDVTSSSKPLSSRTSIFPLAGVSKVGRALTDYTGLSGDSSLDTYDNNENLAKRPNAGLTGLVNLGNTCFMNSALQCMSNTHPLSHYFVRGDYKREINETNPLGMRGEMAQAFGDLMRSIWCSAPNSAVNPRNFKHTVGRFAPQFSGYAQQDSQELLAFLLDGLHEDLNRVRKKPYIEAKDYDGENDVDAANEAWMNYKLRNDSIIVDLFHGQLKSTLVCPVCSKRSVTYDPFCYLSLPLSIKRDRPVLISFVPMCLKSPLLLCQVAVPENGTVKDLAQGLGKLLSVDPERLAIAETSSNRFQKFFLSDDELTFLPGKDLLAFELPEMPSGQRFINVRVYSRVQRKSNFMVSNNLVGMPMLVTLPRDDLSYAKLQNVLTGVMGRFVDWNDPDLREAAETDSGVDDNGDVFMADANDSRPPSSSTDRTTSGCRLPEPFTITTTNVFGSRDSAIFSSNQSSSSSSLAKAALNSADHTLCLPTGDEMTICLEWAPSFEKFLIREPAIEKHESVYASKIIKRSINLSECLDLFTTTERLGKHDLWYCPQCKKHQQATKKFDLWKVPEILIIHLKRFSYDSYYRRKIELLVEFPTENLNMRPWIVNENAQDSCYDLMAVSNHYGSLGGGHYTAYAKNFLTGQWHLFDDSRVSSSDASEIISKAAYVLVYQRRRHERLVDAVTLGEDSNIGMDDQEGQSEESDEA